MLQIPVGVVGACVALALGVLLARGAPRALRLGRRGVSLLRRRACRAAYGLERFGTVVALY
eukprot:3514809-Alexandrium_andersonii.AAC.1